MRPHLDSRLALSAGFEEVSFHEVSGHVGDAHMARSYKQSLGTEDNLPQK